MSNVITSDQFRSDAQPLVALNLCDVEQRARQAVEQAKAEAKRLLVEAVSKSREIERVASARGEKAGYDAGFARGLEEGTAKALAEETKRLQDATATVRDALLAAADEVESHRADVLADARQNLLSLAVAIAGRVCRAHFASDGAGSLRAVLDEVIETTGKAPGMVLRVHPADAEAVNRFLADVHHRLPDGSEESEESPVCLVADESVERGGCVAERRSGRVEATLEVQIERIVTELVGADGAAAAGTGERA